MSEPGAIRISVSESGLINAVGGNDRCITVDCEAQAALSSRELLLAALGGCIAASLQPLMARHAVPVPEISVSHNAAHGIDVMLRYPRGAAAILDRLQRAAENCPVRKALSVDVNFQWQPLENE